MFKEIFPTNDTSLCDLFLLIQSFDLGYLVHFVLLPFGMQCSLLRLQTERDFIYRTSVHCETLFLLKMFNGIQHLYVK